MGIPVAYGEDRDFLVLIEDHIGSLWIGSMSGIYRLLPDARVQHYDECRGTPLRFVRSLLADREGRIWAGTERIPLCRLVSGSDPAQRLSVTGYFAKDGFPRGVIYKLFQGSEGSLWAGSAAGLIRFTPGEDGRGFRLHIYGQPHGLDSENVQAIAEDRSGNLWLGTTSGGAAKLAHSGITAFGAPDGFKSARAIFSDKAGDLNVITTISKAYLINRFDGERFTAVRLKLPPRTYFGWGWNGLVLEDSDGEWWVATGSGLFRFPRARSLEQLGRTPPTNVYTARDAFLSHDILRVFEDSRRVIWVATANAAGLSYWDRATNGFHHFNEQDGLPSLVNYYPISFAEDRAGDIWIGFSFGGGLVRYRNQRFTRYSADDGLAAGGIFNLFIDSLGRLWAPTTRGGVCRVDHPEDERPSFATYTTADGLSSDDVKAITEDRWGRIYLGTGRGIDRLDPATGHIRHYTGNEGALLGDVQAALQDRDGALWFSYTTGLVRLVPEADSQTPAPPVWITALRVAGEPRSLSALGESEVAPIELPANKNDLQIEFAALGFGPGEELRYQYLLDGANQEWSPVSDQRAVNFANLAPGHYRFLVRAVNPDGVMSERPASFSFTVLPPFWQRWWFVITAIAILGAVAYSLYRYRIRRLLEIERVRTRIAADLHDDIGSNLSQIAIWSDVAQRQMTEGNGRLSPASAAESPSPLERIAATARETASSMSDIVWAINPNRDHLSDLVSRMRRFAGETFDYREIDWRFDAPQMRLSINADTRREVFLIFKEAVNNIMRHASCARVEIALSIERGRLVLRIRDDGSGFDPRGSREGHGLFSVRERAANLGGVLDIESTPGSGTTVELVLPLERSRRWR